MIDFESIFVMAIEILLIPENYFLDFKFTPLYIERDLDYYPSKQ